MKILCQAYSRVIARQPMSVLCCGTRTRFLNGSCSRKVMPSHQPFGDPDANVSRHRCSSRVTNEDWQSNAELPAPGSEYSSYPTPTASTTYSYPTTSSSTLRPELLTQACSWTSYPRREFPELSTRPPDALITHLFTNKPHDTIATGNAARWEYPTEYCGTRSATTTATAFPSIPSYIAAAA